MTSSRLVLYAVSLTLALTLGSCDLTEPEGSAGGGSSGGGSSGSAQCSNTCRYANDGECDDGGPGHITSLCSFGSDCSDCGSRANSGGSGGDTSSTGHLMVFTDIADTGGYIDVTIAGRSGRLTSLYSSAPPCPTFRSGATVTAEVAPGSYTLAATSADGGRWSGTYSASAGGCRSVRLTRNSSAPAPGKQAGSVVDLPMSHVLPRPDARPLFQPIVTTLEAAFPLPRRSSCATA